MACEVIDGRQFYHAFTAGYRSLARHTDSLNRMNVFPVADGDTGTNLALTLKSTLEGSEPSPDLKRTLDSLADTAILSAQGNSGIIFAQYLLGFNQELAERTSIGAREFAHTAQKAVKYVYNALLNPVEGTILTVMKDWAASLLRHSEKTGDIGHLVSLALADARQSLQNTPKQLKVLAEAGVLDAGAQGFVHFLEGIYEYIKSGGKQLKPEEPMLPEARPAVPEHSPTRDAEANPQYQYCTECILTHCRASATEIKANCAPFGDSLILAGSGSKLHLHIHTDRPEELFRELSVKAIVSQVKAEDMRILYAIMHHRKYAIGLMSDTAADLPPGLAEQYQIIQVPFGINFGERQYLDKVTLSPENFYTRLKSERKALTSSLPSLKALDSAQGFLATQYEQSICLHIAAQLSSTFQTSSKLAEKHAGVAVADSKHLSVTEGLILFRTARAIADGLPFEQIMEQIPAWSAKTYIYTDIATLRYMVRSGRVSPAKGFLAKALNLRPIVTVDASGKGKAFGTSFSRKANKRKIINIIKELAREHEVWEYAIVHSDAAIRAGSYAAELTAILGKPPAWTTHLSPVVGVHNGVGAVAVGISLK
jgi:uncharacterized protein